MREQERGEGRGRRGRTPSKPPPGDDLPDGLRAWEGRSYREYKRLTQVSFRVDSLLCTFEYVQGDPFASPSRLLVEIPTEVAMLPEDVRRTSDQRRAAADFLHRALRSRLVSETGRVGTGGGGRIAIAPLGQEILDRTAVVVERDGRLRLRLTVGLPAAGRRILGRAAAQLLDERLAQAVLGSVSGGAIELAGLRNHVRAVEDQVALRDGLEDRGLIAFLCDGAILARRSGVDDRPMNDAVAFHAPDTLAVELEAPHAGKLRGLGIRAGITLVVGGGYHGKSTLLEALSRTVYDHVPGDGRDYCVTRDDSVRIRAEEGRSVHNVDLQPFIRNLPLGRDAADFTTDDASGSTSQAAGIVEALEVGARALLIDEDTAAANFMIRDARMRRLVPPGGEPITPFIDRVRQLSIEQGISSILVVGGAGDYLDVADTVIRMETYRPVDVTVAAASVARSLPLEVAAAPKAPDAWPCLAPRAPQPDSFDARRGRGRERVRSRSTRGIEFGTEEIDMSLVGQLLDPGQCRLIGDVLLDLSRGRCDGQTSLAELLDAVSRRLLEGGIEAVAEPGFGDRAFVRRFEIAAAINRLRALRCRFLS